MRALPGNIIEGGQLSDTLSKYGAVSPAMHDIVCVLSSERIITDLFQPMASLKLLCPASFLQKPINDSAFPLHVIAGLNSKLDLIEKTGCSQSMDFTINRAEGVSICHASLSAIFSPDKVSKGFVIVVRDITESVQQENRFYSILNKYNLAVKTANFGIWEFNYLTGEFYWDEVMEQFFGCRISSIQQLRQMWLKLIRPVDYQSLRTSYAAAVKTGQDFHEIFSVKVNGKIKYIETYATFKYNPETKWSEKVTGIALDITAKKVAEIALRKSEEHYRMLADNITDIVVLHQLDGTVDYLSPSAYRVMGHTLEEAQEKGGAFFVHPDDVDLVLQQNHAIIEGKQSSISYECRIQHSNGHWITFENLNKAVYDEDCNIIGILTVCRDITARKMAEEHYRLLAENATDIIGLLDLNGCFEYISPSVERLLGYTRKEMTGTTPFDNVHPDDALPLKEATVDKNMIGQEGFYANYRVKHKDGHWVHFDVASKPVYNNEGKLTHILKSSRDVTQRVLAEQARLESEQQYKILADNIVDLIILLEPDFKRLYVSPSSLQLTGYTAEEFLHLTPSDTIHPDDIDRFFTTLKNTIFKGADQVLMAYQIRHKDGHWLYVEAIIKAIRDGNGNLVNLLSTTRDITRQCEAEIARHKSEEHYTLLADNIGDFVILLTPDFKRLYVSPSGTALTGYSAEELLNGTVRDLVHPDDLADFFNLINSTIFKGDNEATFTSRMVHKDGHIIFSQSVTKAIRNQAGELLNLLATIRDISKQYNAENALRKSEEQYRMLADNMSDLVLLYGPDLSKLYVSPSCLQLAGYTVDEVMKIPAGGLVYEGDMQLFTQIMKEKIGTGQTNFNICHRGVIKGGGWKFMCSHFKIIKDETGAIKNILVTVRDVHAETTARLALGDSEQKYRMLAENMSDLIALYADDFSKQYISPSCLHLTGYTAGEIMNLPFGALLPEDDRELFMQAAKQKIANSQTKFTIQHKTLHKNGSSRYMESDFSVIKDENGHIKNILVTGRDVHAETEARIAVANSEEKYRSLVEASENIILMMDETGKYLFANTLACRYVNKELDEVLGKTIYDFFDRKTADLYIGNLKTVLNTKKALSFECQINVPGGRIWLRNTLNPIFDSAGNAYAVMLSLVDFTEIKTYAEKLRIQNEELKKIAHLQSHIVRAPLANIEGLISLMDEGEMSLENRALMQLLKKSALQLDSLVTEIVEKAINVKLQTHV